jgi:hypothetical protein
MLTTDLLAYPLAAAAGFVAAQAPNTARLYWRFIALPTGVIGTAAILTHDEPLFALVVHLWLAASLGAVLGLFVEFGGGWWRRGRDDDGTPGPWGPDPEDHKPSAEPVVHEVPTSITRDGADLDLWADFEAAPPAPAEPDRMLPVDTREGAALRAGRLRGRRAR